MPGISQPEISEELRKARLAAGGSVEAGRVSVQPESETGEAIKTPKLTESEIAEQVARIEAGKAPTIPETILRQAVAEAKKSDTLVGEMSATNLLERLLNDPSHFEQILKKHGAQEIMDAANEMGAQGPESPNQ